MCSISALYIHRSAIEHEEDEEGIVRNYNKEGELTGMTIIAAKRFSKEAAAQ